MGAIVSSRLDYLNKNPTVKTSVAEIQHEIQHLNKREKLASFVSFSSAVLFVIGVAGLIGGGTFAMGALAAIALVGAAYSYFARQAEGQLRDKQVEWMDGSKSKPVVKAEEVEGGLLSWFKD